MCIYMYVYVYTVDIIRNIHTNIYMGIYQSSTTHEAPSTTYKSCIAVRLRSARLCRWWKMWWVKSCSYLRKKEQKKRKIGCLTIKMLFFFASKSRALSFKPWCFFIMENMGSFQQHGGIQLIHAGQFGTQKNGGWRCIKWYHIPSGNLT